MFTYLLALVSRQFLPLLTRSPVQLILPAFILLTCAGQLDAQFLPLFTLSYLCAADTFPD